MIGLGTTAFAQRTYTIDWDADFDCDLPIMIQGIGPNYHQVTLSNSSTTANLNVPARPISSALGMHLFQPACGGQCTGMNYSSIGGGPSSPPTLEMWDMTFCYCCNGEKYEVQVKIVSDQNTDMIYVNAQNQNEPCSPDGCM